MVKFSLYLKVSQYDFRYTVYIWENIIYMWIWTIVFQIQGQGHICFRLIYLYSICSVYISEILQYISSKSFQFEKRSKFPRIGQFDWEFNMLVSEEISYISFFQFIFWNRALINPKAYFRLYDLYLRYRKLI